MFSLTSSSCSKNIGKYNIHNYSLESSITAMCLMCCIQLTSCTVHSVINLSNFSVSQHWQNAVNGCMLRWRDFSIDVIPGLKSRYITNEILERMLSRLTGLHSFRSVRGAGLDTDIIGEYMQL